MTDLVITHLTHPLGPPWTLETLGDHWRPLATLLENDQFGGNWSFSSRVAKGDLPTFVSKLKILGIFLSANPSEMEEKDKIKEVSDLLGKWTFGNMTVYGRIQIVKSLALSKVTHLIQVIPNPSQTLIFYLQRIINNFVWKGPQQKKNRFKGEIRTTTP